MWGGGGSDKEVFVWNAGTWSDIGMADSKFATFDDLCLLVDLLMSSSSSVLYEPTPLHSEGDTAYLQIEVRIVRNSAITKRELPIGQGLR